MSEPDDQVAVSQAAHDHYQKQRTVKPTRPKALAVGPYTIHGAGGMYLKPDDLKPFDLLVPLTQYQAFGFGQRYQVFACPLVDFGGVPREFRWALDEIIKELKAGKRILVYCDGGMGRTGTVLASLVAILESETATPDPIKAVRERYCPVAVETIAQAQAVFAQRGKQLPEDHYFLAELDELKRYFSLQALRAGQK